MVYNVEPNQHDHHFLQFMVGMIIFFMARSEGEASEDHVDEDESSESESLPAGVDVVS